MNKKRAFLYFGLIVILILLFACISAILGSVRIPLLNVWRILLGDRTDLMQTNIICNIRLPRIVAAILLGGACLSRDICSRRFSGIPW